MSMFTGKSPGELGVYGFKHRRGHAMTHPIELVSRLDYQAKPVWEWPHDKGWSQSSLVFHQLGRSLALEVRCSVTLPRPSSTRRFPDAYRRLLPEDWSWDLQTGAINQGKRFSTTLLR